MPKQQPKKRSTRSAMLVKRTRAKVVGDYRPLHRVQTGFYGLDVALGSKKELGYPLPGITEAYGMSGVGKSTVVYGIAGVLCHRLKAEPALADFDGFDPKFLEVAFGAGGYDGNVHVKADAASGEEMIDSLVEWYSEDSTAVGIIDSVSGVVTEGEVEGEMKDTHMGRRAQLMARAVRAALMLNRISKKPRMFFVVNHLYQQFGFAGGMHTAGGKAIENLSTVRYFLRREKEYEEKSYLVEGRVDKLKFGPRGRQFLIFVKSGLGIHQGLTAVLDCLGEGLATEGEGRKGAVKLGRKSYGYFKNMIERSEDDSLFSDFVSALYSR